MRFLLISSLLYLFACQPPEALPDALPPGPSSIFVEILHRPEKFREYRSGNNGPYSPVTPELQYHDQDAILRSWFPGQERDTLTIGHQRALTEVHLRHRAFDALTYYLRPGDSLRITYSGQQPHATLLNRSAPGLNISKAIISSAHNDGYATTTKAAVPFVFTQLPVPGQSQQDYRVMVDDFLADLVPIHQEEEATIQELLQTRTQDGTLAVDIADRIRQNQHYRHTNFLRAAAQPVTDTLKPRPEDRFSIGYQEWLQNRFRRKYARQFPFIRQHNGSHPDFVACYAAIVATIKEDPLRTDLLRIALEGIAANGSETEITEHLKTYRATTGDHVFTTHLEENYQLDFSNKGELALVNAAGEPTSFQDILTTYTGKVVYVDLWASWCRPCREAMPAATALREQLQEKDVVFVYLALNDRDTAWRKASKEEGIADLTTNYLITNSRTSELLQELGVKTIPRYLLYGRDGKLLHRQAAGPEGAAESILKAL